MVRLVFRPYTHVGRTICTSVPLRASTRVSPGFTLRRHSSPSFGSRRACSRSNPPRERGIGRRCHLAVSRRIALAARSGLPPLRSHARRTPRSVFQDGSDGTVAPASLTCRRESSGRILRTPVRLTAHVGILAPRGRSKPARRWETPPALADPSDDPPRRCGPASGSSAPSRHPCPGIRALSRSVPLRQDASVDDLPEVVADPIRFPFDDFKRF
jgi:hypothetical protein